MDKVTFKALIFEQINQNHGLLKLAACSGIPLKPAYRLSRLISKLESEAKIYMKKREELIRLYCDKDSKGNPIPGGPGQVKMTENAAVFEKKMQQLGDVDVEIDAEKVVLAMEDIPVGTISAMDIISVEPFVTITGIS
jgi:hypothetical protein